MAALLILNYDVHDHARLHAYREAATPALAEAELLVSTDSTVLLGEAPAGGSHTVVLRFADLAAAERAYHSANYQRVVGERLAATTPHSALLVPTRD